MDYENEELTNLRINFTDMKRRYEEELQQNRNRIAFLEEENSKLFKSIKNVSVIITQYKEGTQENDFLKEKILSLENDLSYKQSVIDYLEKLVNNQQNSNQIVK